jgi:hypothetical protein
MARQTTYDGMIGDWQRLHGLVEANKADLPQLELFLAKLGTVLAQAVETTKHQGAMRAAKQEASKSMRKLASQGNRLATLMRQALLEHYGIDEEKLAEFGLQPFRGRARKQPTSEKPKPPQPAPEAPQSASKDTPAASTDSR